MSPDQKIALFAIDMCSALKRITFTNTSFSAKSDRFVLQVIPMAGYSDIGIEVIKQRLQRLIEMFPEFTYIQDKKNPRLEMLYKDVIHPKEGK